MSIKGFSVGGNVERYDYNSLDNLPSEITIDTALSGSSTNPVQNKVVTGAINAATDSVTAISGEVSNLKSAFIHSKVNPYSLTTESPGYLTTSGSINAQSSTNLEVYSDFISLPSGVEGFTFKWWLLTANGGSAWIRAIFYDASKVMLDYASGSIVMVGEDGDYTLYKRTFTLPTGTAFVRISYRTFGSHKAQIVYGEDSNYGLSATDIDANITLAATPSYAFDHIGIRGIAHRGFCRDGAPENTIHAFRAAVANGFDFIEGDLRFTSDGVPVLLHDASINRTARNADGTEISTTINIANITYAQALTYDFGVRAGSEYAGTKIPTLYEFLYFCRDTGSYPYIDCALTSAARANLITVAQKIVDMGMQDRVTFISSNELVLQAYLSVYPKFRVGLLLNAELDSERQKAVKLLMSAFNRVFIDCNVDNYTTYQTSIDAFCEAQGIELELWTIDSSAKINSLPSIVRGVTSNTFNFKVIKRQTAMGTNN